MDDFFTVGGLTQQGPLRQGQRVGRGKAAGVAPGADALDGALDHMGAHAPAIDLLNQSIRSVGHPSCRWLDCIVQAHLWILFALILLQYLGYFFTDLRLLYMCQ